MYKKLLGKLLIFGVILVLFLSSLPAVVISEGEERVKTEEKRVESVSDYKEMMIVKGLVFDKITEKSIPVAALTFFNEQEKFRCISDDEGYFVIKLPAGVYRVIISAEGYYDLFEEVAGRPEQVIELKFALGPADGEKRPGDEQPPKREDWVDPKSPERYEENIRDINLEKDGSKNTIKDDLGGGDSVLIRNGDSDAFITVFYGTREHPNTITILTYYTRQIGAGDLYDKNGKLIGRNEPIFVKTIFSQTFTNLIEYEDSNHDGLFNADMDYEKRDLDSRKEPVFKSVSLKTAWHRSEISESTYQDTMREYSFELTAKNLPYTDPVEPDKIISRETLDQVKFTFHIFLTKDKITKDDVPVYRIDVETGSEGEVKEVLNMNIEEHRSYAGVRFSSTIKYDYLIDGWDYDERNVRNPKLFMAMDIALLHAWDERLEPWLNENMMEQELGFSERLQYQDKEGVYKELYVERTKVDDEYRLVEKEERPQEKDGTPPPPTRGEETESVENPDRRDEGEFPLKEYEYPELIDNNQVRFVDDNDRLGSFSWVNNVTADGRDVLIDFQIHHIGWLKKFFKGELFVGLSIHGGFNLPGAVRIYHDPTISSEMYELDIISEPVTESESKMAQLIFTAGIAMAIITVVLIAFLVTVKSPSVRKMTPPLLPSEKVPQPAEDHAPIEPMTPDMIDYYDSFYLDMSD